MEVNLFHILGRDVVDALTTEERNQIDAISARLSNDPNFRQNESMNHFVNSRIERLKAEAADAQNYQSQLEKTFC